MPALDLALAAALEVLLHLHLHADLVALVGVERASGQQDLKQKKKFREGKTPQKGDLGITMGVSSFAGLQGKKYLVFKGERCPLVHIKPREGNYPKKGYLEIRIIN